ncbi:chromate efflux transporter [Deinococcus antarcticus]|uniref:Chromate efflux transporter n=1 Tax=Deinococcus antarcticus TaxID=1298767 RepID=A0ABV8A8C5_9DEIO
MQVPLSTLFLTFLRLGLTSFGGPVAHLGYYRAEFVERKKWLSDEGYADTVALAQFLPGPASSQVGFATGFMLGGWPGALAAWTGFTLPSVLIMVGFAGLVTGLGDLGHAGWLAGLKVAAVAVVAQAVAGMWASLVNADGTPGRLKAVLALGTAAGLLLWPGAWAQVLALVLCGLIGWRFLPTSTSGKTAGLNARISRRGGSLLLTLFALLLLGLPLLRPLGAEFALMDTVYRAGALVFGGGHVVLPLLQAGFVPGFLSADTFIAGYGMANAVPGPLFTFASYLGAAQTRINPVLGATLATVMIFLPGLLLMIGALPFWAALSGRPDTRRALAGLNAGVVGLLLAALYDPVFTSGIHGPRHLALALVAYAALTAGKVPAWAVVAGCAAVGAAGW